MNIILASTSTVYGKSYLDYILPELSVFFKKVETIVFIPYARPSGLTYEQYTFKAKKAFASIGVDVVGIHDFPNPKQAIKEAQAVFTGGGNTFELVNQMYRNDLFDILSSKIKGGMPYFGTSAGSNIGGVSMKTTNDMPVVYPESFQTMGLIPFNINAHYMDPIEGSTHMGETRETRINEFHVYNDTPVIGLREGSWLEVSQYNIILKGKLSARFFRKGKQAIECPPSTNFSEI